MMRQLVFLSTLTVAGMVLGVTRLDAQPANDTLTYELVQARPDLDPLRKGWIEVAFGASIPDRYLSDVDTTVTGTGRWILEVREKNTAAAATIVDVNSVFVAAHSAENRLVSLQPALAVDPATHQIRVRLLEGNFPDVVVDEIKKAKAAAFYGPAKGKGDADLYLKGLVIAAPESGPLYSIDAKAGYFRRVSTGAGAVGAAMTYAVDKASDIGPDTITVDAVYSKVFVLAPATGVIVNADVLGFEFASENNTRNVATGATAQLVIPSLRLATRSYATADFLLGYEAGKNQTNEVTNESLGGFWRTLVGMNAYMLFQGTPVVKRIDVIASWTLRLLAQEEPFTESSAAGATLTDKPRHHVTVAAEFMFSKALGFSVGYKHGSEPPKYEHVRHRTEIGMVLKLKQVNKG